MPFGCPRRAHQELSRKADEELFGSKAVTGHQFLVAKSRDINAPATGNPTAGGIEGLLDVVPKTYMSSSSSSSSMPNSGGYRDTTGAAAGSARQTDDARAENASRYDYPGDENPKKGERAAGKFRERSEELGESGGVLKRLKPLLDSFIREDAQRTGTLPAADFRRVICEGHGGLWPDLAAFSEGRGTVSPEYTAGENSMVPARTRLGGMFGHCYSMLKWMDGTGRDGFYLVNTNQSTMNPKVCDVGGFVETLVFAKSCV